MKLYQKITGSPSTHYNKFRECSQILSYIRKSQGPGFFEMGAGIISDNRLTAISKQIVKIGQQKTKKNAKK